MAGQVRVAAFVNEAVASLVWERLIWAYHNVEAWHDTPCSGDAPCRCGNTEICTLKSLANYFYEQAGRPDGR